MILKQTFYTCRCDNCQKLVDNGNRVFPKREKMLKTLNEELSWQQIQGKWYCRNCWTADKNDNLVILDHGKAS